MITLTPIEDNNHIYQNQYCSALGVFHGFDSIMLQGMTITADSSGKITIQVPKEESVEREEAQTDTAQEETRFQEEEKPRFQNQRNPTADDEVLYQEEEPRFQNWRNPIAPVQSVHSARNTRRGHLHPFAPISGRPGISVRRYCKVPRPRPRRSWRILRTQRPDLRRRDYQRR